MCVCVMLTLSVVEYVKTVGIRTLNKLVEEVAAGKLYYI